jgi:hypothetical protein
MKTNNSTRDLPTPAWLEHEHAIIETLERIEEARNTMQAAAEQLARLIERDPRGEWQNKWRRFMAAGGVTTGEFCRWLVDNRQIRRTKHQKYLRLIVGS